MDIPAPILDAVREATARHMGSVSDAIAEAVANVRLLDDFEGYVTVLVDQAIQELVYEARGRLTVAVARSATYVGPAKVNPLASAAVNRVAASVYNHAIGGSRLGDLSGEELDAIAETETAIASGHQFNAALCRWCRTQGVKDGQRVRDVIPEGKLKAAYNRLRNGGAKRAAKAA